VTGLVPCFRWQGLSELRARDALSTFVSGQLSATLFTIVVGLDRDPHNIELPRILRDGETWGWKPRDEAWVRIYHRDFLTPSALHRRTFGPLSRFDHHTPMIEAPTACPAGRAVIYLAREIGTAAAEVFGELEVSPVCPNWRLAWIRPTASLEVQDMVGTASMALGVRHSYGTMLGRTDLTQKLARRIYDQHEELCGIRYAGASENGECLALWERAPALEVVRDGEQACESSLTDPETWEEVSQEYAPTGLSLEPASPARCSRCQKAAAKRCNALGDSLSPAA
jgi:hypothetical protein